jgi:hypothetical protein
MDAWWDVVLLAVGGVAGVFVMMNCKTSRSDGVPVATHPYRTMLSILMPTRNGSVVYFDQYVRAEELVRYIREAREHFHCDVTHCVVGAAALALFEAPVMNRFIAGNRLYQRKGVWLTFSMKRKKLGKTAKVSAVKQLVAEDLCFRELCDEINAKINIERSDKRTYADKELALFLRLPRFVLRFAVKLLSWFDFYHLLPRSFIENDPMFTSTFIANLGSLGLKSAYHHLFEWGTCPVFLTVGSIEDRAVVEKGQVVVRQMLQVRITYDERVDDGLNAGLGFEALRRVIEDPYHYFGCVKADKSDSYALSEGTAPRDPSDDTESLNC